LFQEAVGAVPGAEVGQVLISSSRPVSAFFRPIVSFRVCRTRSCRRPKAGRFRRKCDSIFSPWEVILSAMAAIPLPPSPSPPSTGERGAGAVDNLLGPRRFISPEDL